MITLVHPLIAANLTGDPFLVSDILVGPDTPTAPQDHTVADLDFLRSPMDGITLDDAAGALKSLDPDLPMQKWIEVGAGLKHQFGEEGYDLWDHWSSKGKKYENAEETEYRWSTLKANTPNRAPVTIRSVFKLATEAGWHSETLTRREIGKLTAWLKDSNRSTEELLDHGTKRIAKLAPLISTLERKVLIGQLQDILSSRNMRVTVPDLRKEVHKIETEALKANGLPAWTKNFCHVNVGNYFYRYTTCQKFDPEVIDLYYSTPAEADAKTTRPRDFLIHNAECPRVENLRYEPRFGTKRFFIDDGNTFCNTYRATYPKADPDRADEAGRFLIAHLRRLIREPQYVRVVLDILAYHVQFPGKKIRWALLLQGGEGCGKTFIAEVLAVVLGQRNVNKIMGTTLFEPTHNDWAYGYQVVAVEEIRVVGHNRHAVMDKLKPCITDDWIPLRQMREAVRKVPNITNYIMFTNYADSLAVSEETRRYFVLASPLQRAEEIIALGGDRYFGPLYDSLKNNPGGYRAFLEEWEISPDFNPEGRAPVTPYLRQLAQNSASPLTSAVRNIIEDEPLPLLRRDLLSLQSLRDVADTVRGIPEFSDQTLAATLRELGWTQRDRVMVDGVRHNLWTCGAVAKPVSIAKMRAELL